MKTLAHHLLDIAENSFDAGSSKVSVRITECLSKDLYTLSILDNGRGMNRETIHNVSDPFFTTRTTRKVGLGIPLFRQSAISSGGTFHIFSVPGKGTCIGASFVHTHLDRPPGGDIPGVVATLAGRNAQVHFLYQHQTRQGLFSLDSVEAVEALGGVPLGHLKVKPIIREMVQENLIDLGAEFHKSH